MLKMPSISTHAGSQMSTPLIHCHTADVVIQVAQVLDVTHVLTGNVGDGNF